LLGRIAAFVFVSVLTRAQEAPGPAASETASAVRDLQDQVRQLRTLVEEMRAENAESRAAMLQLREDLQVTRALLGKDKDLEKQPAAPARGEWRDLVCYWGEES